MKRIATLFSVAVTVAALCALFLTSCNKFYGIYLGPFLFSVENDEVTITSYRGLNPDVVVPETILGMPVVAIDELTFYDNDVVRSITIPDSVTEIYGIYHCSNLERVTLGDGIRYIPDSIYECPKLSFNEYGNGLYLGSDENPYLALAGVVSTDIEELSIHPDTAVVCGGAIVDCDYLIELVIPEGVMSIGYDAFYECSSLERIYLPSSLQSIDTWALWDCDSLEGIFVSDGNPYYKSVEGILFSGDGKTLVRYAVGRDAESYRIPDGTVYVDTVAFVGANGLAEVIFPDSLEEIGRGAFQGCVGLRKIHLGNSLKIIGNSAFYETSLTEVIFPDSLEVIGPNAFQDCYDLRGVRFGSSLKIIDFDAFYATGLIEVIIPDSVESIETGAFCYADELERVVIGKGVNYIGMGAFQGCSALYEVVVSDPAGWRTSTPLSFKSEEIDLSDPRQNVQYFNSYDRYRSYYFKE